jgi:hypothetical protein
MGEHAMKHGTAGVLVSDFDGTMTHHDFYKLAIERLLPPDTPDYVGFWSAIAEDPFSRSEWLAAVRAAPAIKEGFYTVLSSRDVLPEVERILTQDPNLTQ